jgi:hypothetical protein
VNHLLAIFAGVLLSVAVDLLMPGTSRWRRMLVFVLLVVAIYTMAAVEAWGS